VPSSAHRRFVADSHNFTCSADLPSTRVTCAFVTMSIPRPCTTVQRFRESGSSRWARRLFRSTMVIPAAKRRSALRQFEPDVAAAQDQEMLGN